MFVRIWQTRERAVAIIVSACAFGALASVTGPVSTAEAAYRCRTVPLQKHFPAYGWQKFTTRFCYDRGAQRVVYGGVNRTWTDPNRWGKLLEFKVSDERAGQFSIMGGRGLAIVNISTVEACSPATCAHRVTTFKVRAYWDGGYQWRIGETTGQVAGPP